MSTASTLKDMPSVHRELLPPGGIRKERNADQIASAAVGLDYPATQVGVAGNVTVLYDPALGGSGLSLASS